MKFLITFMFLAALSVAVTEGINYKHHATLKKDVFDVYWYYNVSNTRFYFKIEANTTGWAALGITDYQNGAGMKNYDIALGGVKTGGSTYLHDLFSVTTQKPDSEAYKDFNLTSNGTEINGITTLEFNRKADTGDTIHDNKIKNEPTAILTYAIAKNDASNASLFEKHYDTGLSSVRYNLYTGEQAPIETSTTTISTTTMSKTTVSTTTMSTTMKLTTGCLKTIPSLLLLLFIQMTTMIVN